MTQTPLFARTRRRATTSPFCEGEKGWWWWLNCSFSEQESDSDASIVWLSVMVKHFDLEDVLERLKDDDPGLYSKEESDCEAAGICTYICQGSVATGWRTFPA